MTWENARHRKVAAVSLGRHAFTLVELSLVLVGFGLLVAGVLAGRELVHAAELRSVVSQLQSYDVAVSTFRNKYGGLPGDLPDAGRFWTLRSTDFYNCVNTQPASSNDTCDGDGNGQVGNGFGYSEELVFWQQLGAAGLIKGRYSGWYDYSIDDHSLEACLPEPKLRDVAAPSGYNYGLRIYVSPPNYVLGIYEPSLDGAVSHYYMIGVIPGQSELNAVDAGVLPEDAFALDGKLDDGLLGSGNVRSVSGFSSYTCRDAGTPPRYDVNNRANPCSLFIKSAF